MLLVECARARAIRNLPAVGTTEALKEYLANIKAVEAAERQKTVERTLGILVCAPHLDLPQAMHCAGFREKECSDPGLLEKVRSAREESGPEPLSPRKRRRVEIYRQRVAALEALAEKPDPWKLTYGDQLTKKKVVAHIKATLLYEAGGLGAPSVCHLVYREHGALPSEDSIRKSCREGRAGQVPRLWARKWSHLAPPEIEDGDAPCPKKARIEADERETRHAAAHIEATLLLESEKKRPNGMGAKKVVAQINEEYGTSLNAGTIASYVQQGLAGHPPKNTKAKGFPIPPPRPLVRPEEQAAEERARKDLEETRIAAHIKATLLFEAEKKLPCGMSSKQVVDQVNREFGTKLNARTIARYVREGLAGKPPKKNGRPSTIFLPGDCATRVVEAPERAFGAGLPRWW
ncbi:unnamed protein product [Pseudo-nitzschia multistriata]|uniref:Uncharacterized protein n=1 Tax=Pseudo-nitzschia multistriata TaxID=183589 RepID=A0A448ZMJ0_9STRA|nr:unnamed protein product [Pseudo-nitzschia multistriata]